MSNSNWLRDKADELMTELGLTKYAGVVYCTILNALTFAYTKGMVDAKPIELKTATNGLTVDGYKVTGYWMPDGFHPITELPVCTYPAAALPILDIPSRLHEQDDYGKTLDNCKQRFSNTEPFRGFPAGATGDRENEL